VVADRDGTDPAGKAINRITKVFLGRKEQPAAPAAAAKPVDKEESEKGESDDGAPVGLGSLIPKVEGGE
jgi:hypothetical protein